MSELETIQLVQGAKTTKELSSVFTHLVKNDEALNQKFTKAELVLMGCVITRPDFLNHASTLTRMYGIRQQKCMLHCYQK